MASKRSARKGQKRADTLAPKLALKAGDPVMIIAGGNKEKRPIKGQVGKLKAFVGKNKDRVIIEGLNMVTKHQKQLSPEKPAGKIQVEGSMHASNVMYYAEKIKKPVRLKFNFLEDGTKVRGYVDPESKEFVQI